MRLGFFTVDVFAEEKYAGNQLAVVEDYGKLSDADRQRVAKEFNYSETTFILSKRERNGGYDVRIFTPTRELPFAGHPTLGTAYVIWHELLHKSKRRVVLNLGVGQIPVDIAVGKDKGRVLWMKQMPPSFGPKLELLQFSKILGLEERDLDPKFPVEQVSTGAPFIIVPLTGLDALKRSRLDRERFLDISKDWGADGVLVASRETHKRGNDLAVRVFPGDGVVEDPATGSANGCLAAYLFEHGYLGGNSVDAKVEQGYEMGRPSLLLLRASRVGQDVEVSVGGSVVPVSRGELV